LHIHTNGLFDKGVKPHLRVIYKTHTCNIVI